MCARGSALRRWRPLSADSARWIFGDSLGDPTADEIWAAAKNRPGGVTRTEVSDMFSRNKKRREIERALTVLEDAGRLRRETRQPDRGRHAEVWIPITAEQRDTIPRSAPTSNDRQPDPQASSSASPSMTGVAVTNRA